MAKFQSINTSLNKILNQFNLETAYQEKLILNSWQDLVDKKIAAVTEPVSFENGILILHAQSMMWRDELVKNKSQLIDMVNKSFEQVNIKEIQFV
jgi:predicted nucleic acid-binding Zn ribbon protein